MKVYKSINSVQDELSKIGITKSRTNSQGSGYKFRGIDDIFNAISPLLAKYNLCILPRVLARECVERIAKSGGALFYVIIEVEYDFVCAEDGSKHTVKIFGEAMDSSDKATNKAMSAAYKYACIQTFAIPTEADNEADDKTHEVNPRQIQSSSPVNKTLLTESQIVDFLASIDASESIEALEKSFKSAYRFAHGQQDQEAIKKFTSKKDAKKIELENK